MLMLVWASEAPTYVICLVCRPGGAVSTKSPDACSGPCWSGVDKQPQMILSKPPPDAPCIVSLCSLAPSPSPSPGARCWRLPPTPCAGDVILEVDGVAVPPDADESILYGPPGSVVTLTVKKPPPDGRVLELMLTRATANKPLGEVSVTTAAASAAPASSAPPSNVPALASPELDSRHASGPWPDFSRGEGTLLTAEEGREVHNGGRPGGEASGREGDDESTL